MGLPKVLQPLYRFMETPRGRRLDGRIVRWTGHSVYGNLYARDHGHRHRPPLALTTTGNRTGRARTIAISYRSLDDGTFAIIGSAGGSEREPDWVRNLRVDAFATVHLARRRIPVRATILEGEAKEPLWTMVCSQAPVFATFQASCHRDIPVVVLAPTRPR